MHADPASDSLSPADARSNDVERAFFRRWLKGGSNTPYLFRELSDDDCSDFLAAAQQEPLWSTDFLSLTLRGWVLSDEQSAAAVGRSLVAIGGGEAVEIMRVRSHVETLIARGLLTEREKFGQGFVIPKVAIAQLEERGAIAMEEKAVLGVTRLLSWAHDDQPTYAALSEKVAALEAKKVAWEASPAGHWKAREKMMLTAIYHLADAHFRSLDVPNSGYKNSVPATSKTEIADRIYQLLPAEEGSGLPKQDTWLKWIDKSEVVTGLKLFPKNSPPTN